LRLAEALAQGTKTIARHEVLLLLTHFTDLSRADMLVSEEKQMPDEQCRAFFNAVERRQKGEPLQYIIGEWDFYGLTFTVDKRALIPRGETELLVEEVVETLGYRSARVLDVCTGSGCIAVAVAKTLDVEVVAADISEDALSLARENAARHGVGDRVRFVHSDLAQGLLDEGLDGTFDIVISNPPYILSRDMAELQREVREYEPHLALDGGVDGMDLYRRLLPQAYTLLKQGGGLFLEIGPAGVKELAQQTGFSDVKLLNDYAGLPRMVVANKK